VTLLAKLNGTSNMWMGEPDSSVTRSVEYAATQLEADAIGFTVYPGSNKETEMVEEFREAQETAREYDTCPSCCGRTRAVRVSRTTRRRALSPTPPASASNWAPT